MASASASSAGVGYWMVYEVFFILGTLLDLRGLGGLGFWGLGSRVA